MGWILSRAPRAQHADPAARGRAPPRRGWRAAAGAEALSPRDAETLTDVFVMLQRLRMTHQIEQQTVGRTPGDVITMSELSPLNRSLLNEGLREIVAVQRRVPNFGVPPV